MAKINGNFIALHEPPGKLGWPLPEYHNTLEFGRGLLVSGCFTGGTGKSSSSYNLCNREELERRLWEAGTLGELFFVESNSAHHISMFIAKCAYEEFNSEAETPISKFLIINFDQHEDYGSEDSELFCGNWGAHSSKELQCDYLIIGRKQKKDAVYYPYGGSKTIYSLEKDFDIFDELCSRYDKIYVTVDMDVLNSYPFFERDVAKRTNWNHGDKGIGFIETLISRIPSDKIIAADITGFPPKPKEDKTEEADVYLLDIIRISNILDTTMGRPFYV